MVLEGTNDLPDKGWRDGPVYLSDMVLFISQLSCCHIYSTVTSERVDCDKKMLHQNMSSSTPYSVPTLTCTYITRSVCPNITEHIVMSA